MRWQKETTSKKVKSGTITNTRSSYQNSRRNFHSSRKLTANPCKKRSSGWIELSKTSSKKLQKQLSRKRKGSRRYKILAKRIAKLHEKVKNQRRDFLHKLSKQIIGDNQAVIVEDLNVKGLVQNTSLSKHIADASWSRFVQFLEYKAKLYGRVLIKVDTFFPSSKLCSVCGFKKEDLKLSEREWECPVCKAKHDRDYNATLNLLREGLTHLKRVVGVDCSELMPVEGTFVPCEAGSSSIH